MIHIGLGRIMSTTTIEWTETTWNPVTGCSKVSPGCLHCYAERMAKRLQAMGQSNYRDGFAVRVHDHMLEVPARWAKPRMVFINFDACLDRAGPSSSSNGAEHERRRPAGSWKAANGVKFHAGRSVWPDPTNPPVTLSSLDRAASAVGNRLKMGVVWPCALRVECWVVSYRWAKEVSAHGHARNPF